MNFHNIFDFQRESKYHRKYHIDVTPEIYVLSNKFEQLYHGRIDDSQRESEISTTDLKNALKEILEGKEVNTPETKAFGCSIKRI